MQTTVRKKTRTMPVVQALNAIHAASSADKHAVSLQAMQVPIDEWDVCRLVAESPPQHVMAQPALLVTKPGENAIIPDKAHQRLPDTICRVQWMLRCQNSTKPLSTRIWPLPFRKGHMAGLRSRVAWQRDPIRQWERE